MSLALKQRFFNISEIQHKLRNIVPVLHVPRAHKDPSPGRSATARSSHLSLHGSL